MTDLSGRIDTFSVPCELPDHGVPMQADETVNLEEAANSQADAPGATSTPQGDTPAECLPQCNQRFSRNSRQPRSQTCICVTCVNRAAREAHKTPVPPAVASVGENPKYQMWE